MLLKLIFRSYVVFVMLCIANISFAQKADFEEVLNAYESDNIEDIYNALQKIDTTQASEYDKATWLYYYADYHFNADNHDVAYKSAIKAKQIFSRLDEDVDVKDCNILLLGILEHQENLVIKKDNILRELEEYGNKNNDTMALIATYAEIGSKYLDLNDAENALLYFKKIKTLYQLNRNELKVAHSNMNIGVVFNLVANNIDSALHYTQKAVPVLKKYEDFENLAYNHNNQAQQYRNLKNYAKAIENLKKANAIPLKNFEAKSKVIFYKNLAEIYMLNKEYKKSALFFEKLDNLKDSINDTRQNIAISEIKEKFDNEKLRADNLEIEAKNTQNRNIAIGLGGSLALGGVIVFLVYKNKKRKQELILQNKELKEKELTTKLKEQELVSINAMIEGQEKERLRIANDLHDDLGSHMATIKMYFSSFKDQDSKNLFNKTNTLIEEAYQKIRNIAHTKNSGVLAKQGLLKAVRELAGNISNSEKIQIKVYENGLNQRLENSIELTLFRIIQELIANVIKHANATEVDIHLSEDENMLNIMVEDNGKGFDTSRIIKNNNGIGLSSIDKRIEDLNGKMIIESQANSGTSVIIELPLI